MMDEFDNQLMRDGEFLLYKSRLIASWLRAGGKLQSGQDYDLFKKWLVDLGLTEEEARYVYYMASNGKMEWEHHAEEWLKRQIKE